MEAYDNGLTTGIVFLDLRKVFDSVPHNELLYIIGIMGELWLWFMNYLYNRQHHNAVSESLPVISRVPQGSILGPLLFLIYINDIPSSISYASVFDNANLLMLGPNCRKTWTLCPPGVTNGRSGLML